MSGFANSVLGGASTLIRKAIKSPNFVTTVSGWTINKDGSAEFNNLTIRGSFQGTLFVINSSGAFFYSPTEAAGNLIASIAPANGTDAFGNAYVHGIASYGGGIDLELFSNALSWGNAADAPFIKPSIFGTPSAANGNFIQISSAEGQVGDTPGAITVYDSRASGPVAAIPTGSPGIFLAGNCYIYSDTWHSLGAAANFTINNGRNRYRFTPWGAVEFDIDGSTNGANAASVTFANALAAAYQFPAGHATRRIPMTSGRVVTAGETFPYLQIDNAGNVSLNFNAANIAAKFTCVGSIPFDT